MEEEEAEILRAEEEEISEVPPTEEILPDDNDEEHDGQAVEGLLGEGEHPEGFRFEEGEDDEEELGGEAEGERPKHVSFGYGEDEGEAEISIEEEEIDECTGRFRKREDRWELLNDEEKKYLSKIYIEIIMDIGTQNRILNQIKKKLLYLTKNNPCPTKCEEREIRGLKCCVKRETLRQQCYMRKAKEFLANAPVGPWNNIPITTTDTDIWVPTQLNCTMTEAICMRMLESKKKKKISDKYAK